MNYLITTILFLTAFVLSVNSVTEQVARVPSAERPKREFSYSSPIFKNNFPTPSVKPHPLPVPQTSQAVTPVPVVGAFFVPFNTFGNNLAGYNYGNAGGLGGFWSGLHGQQPGQQCPLGQFYRCRCDNILPREMDSLEILQQSIKYNQQGEKILNAQLSNGLNIHQKTSLKKLPNNQESQIMQGYYVLKVKEQRYLIIYFDVNEKDYTVQADVKTQPPRTDL
ncbi:uncharacterized protein ACN427_012243 [Glossina fuscipes fuscipes]|nr:hypothetical protein GQX74_007821 [Glossina fuscipes]